ncbi:unnamed protein product [Vicia faba]|uniref:Reverse transcriptase zinc-binding domain-containing protein n=1 Tax=Vicia faba TaxID=3906 RepID=A0AAV1B9X1_VICFA|nr:unnamed protein product [Vicia faba]
MNIVDTTTCLLCGTEDETRDHVFFQCRYSQLCWKGIKDWLLWQNESNNLDVVIRWIERRKTGTFRLEVCSAANIALVYHLWRIRNDVLWNHKLLISDRCIIRIIDEVINRCNNVDVNKLSINDRNWPRKTITR